MSSLRLINLKVDALASRICQKCRKLALKIKDTRSKKEKKDSLESEISSAVYTPKVNSPHIPHHKLSKNIVFDDKIDYDQSCFIDKSFKDYNCKNSKNN